MMSSWDKYTAPLGQNPKVYFGTVIWRAVKTKNQRKRINRKANKVVF